MSKQKITIDCRIWLNHEGSTFLAPGKAALLNNVKELGSLRKAAAKMEMSYRKAWYSLKQVNENAPEPMVVLHRGGSTGGSASLTDYGGKILEKYDALLAKTHLFLETELKK